MADSDSAAISLVDDLDTNADAATIITHRTILGAGLLIFRRLDDDKIIEYLLLQASDRRGLWSPPKGHIDRGETDITAAQRETFEETGLTPQDYDLIPNFTTTLDYEGRRHGRRKPKHVVLWCAQVKNPQTAITLSREHTEFRWCELSALDKIMLRPETKIALTKLEAFILSKN